jgi:hypothetical protein
MGGGISGVVVDKSGVPIPGVAVVCTSSGARLQTFADDTGRFAFELQPGDWTLSGGMGSGAIDIPLDAGERLDGVELEVEPVWELGIGNFF